MNVRDASATINGFCYQVDLTIDRWLNLEPGHILELERGEDIDEVWTAIEETASKQSLIASRLSIQVKHMLQNVTLRSASAVKALVHFYDSYSCTDDTVRRNLFFHYMTNAKMGKERPLPPAIETGGILAWNRIAREQLEQEEQQEVLSALRAVLLSTGQPRDVSDSKWAKWRAFLEEGNLADFATFISRVEWHTQSPASRELQSIIQNRLIGKDLVKSQDSAFWLYVRLFQFVFKKTSQEGVKRLTSENLSEIAQALPAAREEVTQNRVLTEILSKRLQKLEKDVAVLSSSFKRLNNKVGSLIAGGMGGFTSYQSGSLILDPPLPLERFTPRQKTVGDFVRLVKSRTLLALNGEIGSGKTQLALMTIKELGNCRCWVRLRALEPGEAAIALHLSLAKTSGLEASGPSESWIGNACSRISGSILVFDDLPDLAAHQNFSEQLALLVKSCHRHAIKVITTSNHILPSKLKDLVSDFISEQKVPMFSNQEIRELLKVFGAPPELLSDFSEAIEVVSQGHPTLVAAATRYLSENGWARDRLFSLLAGEHATLVEQDIQKWLQASVGNANTRELLYRLTLAGPQFPRSDVAIVSQVEPAIDRPYERIIEALGLWIQGEGKDLFAVSPLLMQVGRKLLSEESFAQIHWALGKAIVAKPMNQMAVIKAVNHFCQANDWNLAGSILSSALMALATGRTKAPETSLLLAMWRNTPLPKAMSTSVALVLRSTQVNVNIKAGIDPEYEIADLDRILESFSPAGEFEVLAGFMSCSQLAISLTEHQPRRAVKYLAKALNLKTNLASLPQGADPEALVWVIGNSLKTPDDLKSWVSLLSHLTPDQVRAVRNSDSFEDGCLYSSNSIVRAEMAKHEKSRDWHLVEEALKELSAAASNLGIQLLWAASIRARIEALVEAGKRDNAVRLAEEFAASGNLQPAAMFIVKAEMGRRLLEAGLESEASHWLLDAASVDVQSYIDHQALNSILCSISVGNNNEVSLSYAKQAVDLAAAAEDIPERLYITALGEYSIAVWRARGLEAAFDSWELTVERLLEHEEDCEDWKSLFVICGHVSGYFTAVAQMGKPPEGRDGGDYAAPRRGMILSRTTNLLSLFDPKMKHMIAAQLALYAEAVGNDRAAVRWYIKALEMAKKVGNIGPVRTVMAQEAICELISESHLGEALDDALTVGAYYVAGNKVRQSGGDVFRQNIEPTEILGSKPSDSWNSAEEYALIYGVLPCMFHLAGLYSADRPRAREGARELLFACQTTALTASRRPVWDEVAEIVEMSFLCEEVERFSWAKGVIQKPREDDASSILRAISYVGACSHVPLEISAQLHVLVLQYIESVYEAKSVYRRRLVVPFIQTYWTRALDRSRFKFRNPGLFEEQLKRAVDSPFNIGGKAVLREVFIGLGIRPRELWDWVNS